MGGGGGGGGGGLTALVAIRPARFITSSPMLNRSSFYAKVNIIINAITKRLKYATYCVAMPIVF